MVRPMTRNLIVLALAAGAVACGSGSSGAADAGQSQCLGTGAPGTVAVFAAGIGASEGIAFLGGRLFVSGGPGIREIKKDGTAQSILKLTPTIGMVAWKDALYVASSSDGTSPSTFCDAGNHGVIYKVTPDGQSSIFARGFISPNFLTVTPWGTLLVADDCVANKKIYEVDATGKQTIWLDGVTSANGMVFNAANDALFVATTFSDPDTNPLPLYKIPVGASGKPGDATKFYNFPSKSTPDGVAMDSAGNIYAALNVTGKIHKVTPDGTDTVFADDNMLSPASLAFGAGPDFDPCSMYVTSLIGDDLYRVAVGTTGVPLLK